MTSSPAAVRTNRRRPYVEHEEEAQFCVLVLVSVQNIAVRKQKFAMVATSPLRSVACSNRTALSFINLFFEEFRWVVCRGQRRRRAVLRRFSTRLLKFSISNQRYYHGHGVPEARIARWHDAAPSRDI
jgi:hypothetical protein